MGIGMVLCCLVGTVFTTALCILLGVFIGMKVKNNTPGLLGSPPEPTGDVFTVETAEDSALFPGELMEASEEEEHIADRTKTFLDKLGAGGNT